MLVFRRSLVEIAPILMNFSVRQIVEELAMAYLYLLIGIVDLILVWLLPENAITFAIILGIIYVIFGLYEVFMPRK